MLVSAYSWLVTVWKPMAGPPERISRLTPVGAPLAYNGPETDFLLASMTGFGPSIWYRWPCSASGFQSVWMTTVEGQPAAARSTAPAAAVAAGVLVLEPEVQAARATIVMIARPLARATFFELVRITS